MTSPYPSDLFVNGGWEPPPDRFAVFDPATDEVLAKVADADVAAGLAAVTAAHDALPSWSATAPRQRAEILRRAWEIMTAEAETITRTIVLENGKAWADAAGETAYAAEFFRWFSEEAARVPGDFRLSPAADKTIVLDHRPIGVSVLVTPWNFPAAMATRKIAPALAAGCTVVLKPAAETPLTALLVADVLRRAGAPAGVVNVVTTTNAGDVVKAMLADERVRKLSFTGSTAVGRILLHEAADRIVSPSMELGGNAPFLVLEGSDVDTAVEVAMIAKMRNGGAACTAANRFYVHATLAGAFAGALGQALGKLAVGPGLDRGNDLGAMVSTGERDKITGLVAAAEDDGASVYAAGTAPVRGAFVAPAVLTGVEHGTTITREEIFGPIAPIITFDDEADAVRMANDTEYGLISYVVGGTVADALRVGRRMDSGMVAVNRGVASDPAAAFGGTKQSGLGREGGFHGIHEFLEPQYLAVDL
ncbi:NAD-dependent succinate-semialdehyde dehydrogenase [Amycolatopsis sp. FDAARGOS 1241]|uniref:NAD-dependent succinate-semialdehyde dehydrogenase n=1 Tax=Amycolatopsis sp. FDAARGOS 1241 TaxID=2778070 RepID=UPI00194E829E|nr:NAD-dependent succinate-semialdehyde dehydrogenase [Amycolatopsis sp. FDAARGOS 1241]QRP49357.1 NAD-dependent succinate-semialdehyde dehydrogenase [Amycolatopsis sp. FDAARGOS 1241]